MDKGTDSARISASTLWSVLLDNAKLIVMYALGAWLIAPMRWPLGEGGLSWIYLAYCVLSLVFFIAFICPYCFAYQAGTCKSGYHVFAGLFKPRDVTRFRGQFKRYVAVLFPAWFLPPLVGIYLTVTRFSWLVVIQLVLFCLVAFVILPIVSARHSCQECKNAENCPFRKDK